MRLWTISGILLFGIVGALGWSETAHAQKAIENFQSGAQKTLGAAKLPTTGSTTDLPRLAGTLIGRALSLIAVVFFLITLVAGFFWMFALGNEDRAKKAKDTIVAAVAGLIVIMGSYAITDFVLVTIASKKSEAIPTNIEARDQCGQGAYSSAECVDQSRCGGKEIYPNAIGCTGGQVCCSELRG